MIVVVVGPRVGAIIIIMVFKQTVQNNTTTSGDKTKQKLSDKTKSFMCGRDSTVINFQFY